MKKEAYRYIHSPGIQIVTHTVQDNGRLNKKLKFPSTCSVLFMQVAKKTCKHKSKPISATNAAFRYTLGLLLC